MALNLGELSAFVRADTSRFNADLVNAQGRGSRFVQTIETTASNIGRRFNEIGGAGRVAMGNIGQSISNLIGGLSRLGLRAGSIFSRMGEAMTTVGRSMQNLGGNITKYITLPLSAAGVSVFKLGKDFERELSKVVGLVGVSQKQVDEWGKEILTLAPELGKAPLELAEALFFVTSAGIRGAEAMDVLTMSGKASAAGLGETKTIADLVTSAMNAYGKENLSAAKATDIVTMAVREGKAEASELAGSMGQVLPLAAEMGVSFDQVAAAQAAMTKTGTPATEAATQLKSIMAGLIKPSQQAQDQLKAMGTSAGDMRKSIKEGGLLGALMDLREMTNKYGEEAMSTVFPNIRALMGVLDLMGSSLEANKVTFDKVSNSTGTLDEAFKSASQTLDFKWNQTLSKTKATALEFFDALKVNLIPVFETISNVLTFVADKFKSLSPVMQQVVVVFGAIAAVSGPIITALGILAASFGAISGVVGTVITAISAAIGAISGPILAIVGIVSILIAAIVLIVSKFYTFEEVINLVKGHFNTFLNVMSEIGNFLISVFSPVIEQIKTTFQNMDMKQIIESFGAMKETVGPLLNFLKDLGVVLGVIIATAIGTVIGVVNGLINAFSPLVATILNFAGIITSLFGIIIGIVRLDGDMLKKSFSGLWENIKGFFVNGIDFIVSYVKGFIEGIVGFFQSLYDTIVGHSIIPDLINGIIDWFKRLPSRIISTISNLISSAINKFNQLKTNILNVISSLLNYAIARFNQIKSAIIAIISGLVSAAIDKWRQITSRFTSIISSIKEKALSKFRSLKSSILNLVSGINLFNAGKNLVQSLINGIKNMYGNVKKVTRDLAAKIRDFFPFSPAKEGPLKSIDKIDFYSSIAKSLNRAKSKIGVPAIKLAEEISTGIQKSPQLKYADLFGNKNEKNIAFNGAMNFYGIQDSYSMMKELRSTILRYSGRF